MEPSPHFSTQLFFWTKSEDSSIPSPYEIHDPAHKRILELNSIRQWRRMLSNSYKHEFLDKEGNAWQCVDDYVSKYTNKTSSHQDIRRVTLEALRLKFAESQPMLRRVLSMTYPAGLFQLNHKSNLDSLYMVKDKDGLGKMLMEIRDEIVNRRTIRFNHMYSITIYSPRLNHNPSVHHPVLHITGPLFPVYVYWMYYRSSMDDLLIHDMTDEERAQTIDALESYLPTRDPRVLNLEILSTSLGTCISTKMGDDEDVEDLRHVSPKNTKSRFLYRRVGDMYTLYVTFPKDSA